MSLIERESERAYREVNLKKLLRLYKDKPSSLLLLLLLLRLLQKRLFDKHDPFLRNVHAIYPIESEKTTVLPLRGHRNTRMSTGWGMGIRPAGATFRVRRPIENTCEVQPPGPLLLPWWGFVNCNLTRTKPPLTFLFWFSMRMPFAWRRHFVASTHCF